MYASDLIALHIQIPYIKISKEGNIFSVYVSLYILHGTYYKTEVEIFKPRPLPKDEANKKKLKI